MEWYTIAAYIASIATPVAAFIGIGVAILSNNRVLKAYKKNLQADKLCNCSERYVSHVDEISTAITEDELPDYLASCKKLIELFAHQYRLWELDSLPEKTFIEWATFNSHPENHYKFGELTIPIVWKQDHEKIFEAAAFPYKSKFVEYMNYVYGGKHLRFNEVESFLLKQKKSERKHQ
ncbi:MAG: hypothetical protein FWB74_04280 [Defluviitaleaceae bacterium]|nr:hypothetical protein [Defluviitaleaceae bacterium]